MKIRLLIKTPPGQARGTEKKLRGILLGMKRANESGINEDESSFYWELDLTIKQYLHLQKKVYMFQDFTSGLISHRLVQGAAKKMGATTEQITEVRSMFKTGTKIDIIKEATAQEQDENNKTYWQKIKEKFKKN